MNKQMTYGSICSGIEAATVAWHGLGWQPKFFSEIEPFPCEVLKTHYPNIPNYGDLTKYNTWNLSPRSVDLLVGGTPCQSFSLAGLRKGLQDPRGNLCLTFLGLVEKLKPQWVLWENVAGVLSSGSGRDFGSFLGALGQIGYGWAYRVLDAQYFGVAQRRRRVFVVGYLGDWRRAAEVLFEPESLSGNPPPSREKGQRVAPTISTGAPFSCTGNERVECDALAAVYAASMAVRRITPVECERLQGFPDHYTAIPWRKKPASECPDGPRYKALGNSMAVPLMRWIGNRIQMVEDSIQKN